MRAIDDLTVPRAGAETARWLYGEYLRHLTARFVALSDRAPGLEPVTRWAKELLAARRPGALYAALRLPTVSVLVRLVDGALSRGEHPHPAICRELAALVSLELALGGELPAAPLELPCPPILCALGARRAIAVPSGALLGCGPNGAELSTGGVRLGLDQAELEPPLVDLHGYHALDADLVFATVDNNPLAGVDAHPEKSGSRVDLGGHDTGTWLSSLEAALSIIREHLPELARELALASTQLIPVGFSRERHESASYAEAVGSLYLSLHPDPLTLAEALIHEHSHGKLNALSALGPLLESTGETFTSPVRPDPRPLHGVLLAVHAFVPVAVLYERMRSARDPQALTPAAERRFRQVLQNNREGTRTLLEHARPSAAGAALLAELRRWDQHFA
ncbi:MAG: hypothetical protein IPM35_00555 [Myxococcales bacterium]|nr:hypothetical protein [Myxococcales bacterium]